MAANQKDPWADFIEVGNSAPQPTLQERKGETDILQGQASAENAGASAEETRALLAARQRKLNAEADLAEQEAARGPKLTDAQLKQQQDIEGKERRAATIDSILGGVQTLYEQDIKGQPLSRLGGATEYIDSIPANDRFRAAGANLLPLIRPLVAQSAKEGDSDKEMTIFESYTPSNDDSDAAIEWKIGALRTLVDGMLQGKPPSQTLAERPDALGIDVVDESKDGGAPLIGVAGPDGGGSGGSGGGGGQPPAPDGGGDWDYRPYLEALKQGAGSAVKGAFALPGLIANPLMNTAYSAMGYEPNYDMGAVARDALGLPANKDSTADALISNATSALTGSGLMRYLASAATSPGTYKSVMELMGAQPVRDTVATLGGTTAAEVTKAAGGGPLAQTGAALLGGGLAYGGANAAAHAITPKTPTEFAQLAKRYGVDYLPTDTGSDVAKLVTNAGTSSPLSVGSITSGAKEAQKTLGRAAQRVAAQASTNGIATSDEAGEFLRSAAKRYAENTRDIGNTNYQKAWEAAGPLTIPARKSDAVIAEQIRTLRKQPERNANQIAELQQLRRDLVRGQDAKSLHALRSDLRQGVFDGKLRSGTEQARMKAIGAALGDDLTGYLDSVGLKGAANKVRKADAYWKQRVEQIDEVLQPIIGKDDGSIGGEQIVGRIESMARGQFGGNKRLSRLMANMTEPERQQVRSTIIDRMGRTRADDMIDAEAGETPFSASHFLANWEKMTPQGKATLFGSGDMRTHIDDIAKLAKGMSNSERIAKSKGGMRGAFGNSSTALQAGWALAHFPSWLAGAGAQYLTGKLMASPAFARHLARAPATKDPRTWVQQIGTMAAREPALKNDLMNFQQGFMQSLETSPAPRVYADEEDNDVGGEPVGGR